VSIKVMGECWPVQVTAPQKAVLMSLADQANDHGVCWPSIAGITERTCLHRATVIRAIEQLEELGYVTCVRRSGAKTLYTVDPSQSATGTRKKPVAQSDPSQSATGRTERPHPSHSATGPVALCDPNRNNPQEPKDDDDAREPVPGEQDLPSWVPVTTWREFYRHRAVIRKPLSIPGQRQVVKRLTELRGQGADIGASLEQTMAAGLAIPVLPRDPDQPGESHANSSPGRRESVAERAERFAREGDERERRQAAQRRDAQAVVTDGRDLRPPLVQLVR